MAKAVVSVADACARNLPKVSVKSGEPAVGYASVAIAKRRIHLPLTQDEFDRVADLQRRQQRLVLGGIACLFVGLILARFPLMVPLALVIAAISVVLWVALRLALRAYLPGIAVEGSSVRLTRLHAGFVAALASSDS